MAMDSGEGLALYPQGGVGLWGCLWGPHASLVDAAQEGLHPVDSVLPPGTPNLHWATTRLWLEMSS